MFLLFDCSLRNTIGIGSDVHLQLINTQLIESVLILPIREAETVVECFLWKEWKSRCLSYLLDKRTIKILSGANLIFSAPKDQWIKVFEQLKVPSDTSQDNLLEIMVYVVNLVFFCAYFLVN